MNSIDESNESIEYYYREKPQVSLLDRHSSNNIDDNQKAKTIKHHRNEMDENEAKKFPSKQAEILLLYHLEHLENLKMTLSLSLSAALNYKYAVHINHNRVYLSLLKL